MGGKGGFCCLLGEGKFPALANKHLLSLVLPRWMNYVWIIGKKKMAKFSLGCKNMLGNLIETFSGSPVEEGIILSSLIRESTGNGSSY